MKDFFKLRVYLLLISKREGGILYVVFGMQPCTEVFLRVILNAEISSEALQ